jgi:hypothetical protein
MCGIAGFFGRRRLDAGARARDFERIVAALDEPFADPSSFSLWYLARAASAHVRVVMGGDGGDELFAGYKRYAKHLASRWRGRLRCPALARRAPRRLPGRWRKLADELALDWLSAYSLRFSGMPPSLRRFLQPDFRTGAGIYWDRMPDREQRQGLSALLEIDMNNYLPVGSRMIIFQRRSYPLFLAREVIKQRMPLPICEWPCSRPARYSARPPLGLGL